MNDRITAGEVMIFAVAVHEAVNEYKPAMPGSVIMDVVTKIDFNSETLAEDVRRLVYRMSGGDDADH